MAERTEKMERKSRKGVWTLKEMGQYLRKKNKGYFKNDHTASDACRRVAVKLGLGDINGKKSYQQFPTTDAERIMAIVQDKINTKPRKRRKAEQITLGDFGIEWFEPEAPAEPTQIPSVEPSEASMEIDPNELRDALMELVRAVHRVADIIGYEGSEI